MLVFTANLPPSSHLRMELQPLNFTRLKLSEQSIFSCLIMLLGSCVGICLVWFPKLSFILHIY